MNSDSLYGGLSAERYYTLPNFPSSTHTLRARLIPASGTAVEIASSNATGSGEYWTLLIPAASLEGVAAGAVTLLVIATSIASSTTLIAAKEHLTLYASDATDLRSHNQKVLEALNAVIEGKASQDQTSISYNGRSISRMSWDDLLKARDAVKRLVKAEQAKAAGRSKIQSVGMRFTNAI